MKASPNPKRNTGVLLKLTRELIMLTGVLIKDQNKQSVIPANRHTNQATGRVLLRLKKTRLRYF